LLISIKDSNKNHKDRNSFFYSLNIYEKNEIIKGESLNTIALIDSNSIHSDNFFSNTSIDKYEYTVKDFNNKEVLVASFFIKLQNNEEDKDYYVYIFEIIQKEKKNKYTIILIIGLVVFIMILLIVFLFICINFMREKLKILKIKVKPRKMKIMKLPLYNN